MQYRVHNAGEKAVKLDRPNIDTGMGLERTVAVLNGAQCVYDFGCLRRVIDFMGTKAAVSYQSSDAATRAYRIITDHLRSSVFILGDERGVLPSNLGQGYVLRRFIRRAVNCARNIGLDCKYFADIADIYVDEYGQDYQDIHDNRQHIKDELIREVEKFSKALEEGHKEFEKVLPVIRNEIFEYHFYDDRAGDVLRELWFDSRYISPILGEIGYLERLEEDEIDGVREKLFTDGMCLFLAGAFSDRDVRAVEASFGSMRLEPFSPDPPREEEKVTAPYSRWGRGREWQALVTYHVEKADTELKMAAHWLRSGLFDGLDAAFFRYFGDNGFQFYSVDGSYNVRGDELVFSYLCYIKKRERALFEGLIDGFEKYAEKTDFLRLVRPYLYDNIVLLCDNPERLCSHYVDAWADHSAPVTLREEYEFCGRFDNARLVRNWKKIASSLRRVFYLGK